MKQLLVFIITLISMPTFAQIPTAVHDPVVSAQMGTQITATVENTAIAIQHYTFLEEAISKVTSAIETVDEISAISSECDRVIYTINAITSLVSTHQNELTLSEVSSILALTTRAITSVTNIAARTTKLITSDVFKMNDSERLMQLNKTLSDSQKLFMKSYILQCKVTSELRKRELLKN